ncbi:Acyl carrier protein [Amycolatopsis xylanica]|uniref:Acyl carrier protein n=1 Tax=Amycolatopsis xylanica TaxID=589385 RepID=A0A1H2WCF2_9PSEU|nr:acyl carrier protein [Amycolatopsis xylanica]SDW77964.1 Acyl carrier protein [Amycolatopsis xylanica]
MTDQATTTVSEAQLESGLAVVRRALSEQAGASPESIDLDKPLSAIPGIESVKALRAITQIEDEFDVVIPDDFLFESATVREFAAYLAGLVAERGQA